jgi:Rrf2 family iron-sulfur cluster assembly transcriptional regulator
MRVEYAARAIIDLAEHYGDGLARVSEIARRQAIPEPFLAQLLLQLRSAGLVQSTRGPAGGYALSRRPDSITLAHVVQAVGEEFLEISCLEQEHCVVFPGCVLADIWRALAADYQAALTAVSVQALVERAVEKEVTSRYSI